MKKSNLITLSFICILIVVIVLVMILKKDPTDDIGTDPEIETPQIEAEETDPVDEDTNVIPTDTSVVDPSDTNVTTEAPETQKPVVRPEDVSMDDALFIGDSRTVGIMEYASIDGADFFCDVGMSVYNVHKKNISVSGVGKVTLTELLEKQKYKKIYVMLGVNEVGYDFNSTAKKYGELVDLIEEEQSDALIFIQANLHVSKKRSDSDKVVNNKAINTLNAKLKDLANGTNRIYIDINSVFDDENGCLSSDKSGDGTHPYAKYYKEWGEWIIEQTASYL